MQRKYSLCVPFFIWERRQAVSRRYKYLKYGDRVQIEEKIKEGKDVREIASEIGVHFDTIYKEFRRAGMTKETYDAEAAQKTL